MADGALNEPLAGVDLRQTGWLFFFLAVLFIAVWLVPPAHSFEGLSRFLPLHSFMETFAVVVAVLVFGIGWNAYSAERPFNVVLLSCAFLAVGLLDFAHMLSYAGMPDFVTPSGPQKAIDFWLAARFLAAMALLLVALMPWKPFPSTWLRYGVLAASLGFALLVYWVILFHESDLPATFVAGKGLTPFKIGSEYFIVFIHLLTLGAFLAGARKPKPGYSVYLLTAVVIMVLSELCFTLYSSVTDIFNLMGHAYKVLAYVFIYRAVFVSSVQEPYKRLRQSEQHVWQEKERAQVTLISIGDGVITTDAKGLIEYLNPVAEKLSGWRCIDAQGMPLSRIFNVINEYTRAAVESPVEECLRNGNVVALANHTILIRQDGSEISIEDTAAPIRDRDGAIIGSVLVFHDVTERQEVRKALRENEERLRTLINAMPDIVCFKDGSGRWLEANDFDLKLLKLEGVPYRGKTNSDLAELSDFYGETFRNSEASDEIAWRSGGPRRANEVIPRPGGGGMVFDVIKVPLFNPDGSRRALVVVGRDITEMVKAQNEKQQLSSILEATPDFVSISTLDGRLVYMNQAGKRMLGIPDGEDVTGLPTLQAYPQWVWGFVGNEAIPFAIENGVWEGESTLLSRDGSEIPVSQVIIAHKAADGQEGFLSTIARDISERKRFEEQLLHQSNHDALSGLPNRLLFHDRLGQALVQASLTEHLVAVMLLDLNRFKIINDTLGHDLGDLLLKEVALRFATCMHGGDTIARWGGDEFVFLLPNLGHPEEAAEVAERILNVLSQPFLLADKEIFVSASIGITLYPTDVQTREGLIQNAEVAMYRAKEHGESAYQFFTGDMNARAFERLVLENSLRKALERKELLLYYQPQVDLATGKISGMEALLRWQHPELGMVSPAQFIPLAEETGLIVPIGEWVLREACRQNKAWQDAGMARMRVSVNLSARQFQQQDIVEMTAAALQESGLTADCLELELTESYIMQNPEVAISTLKLLEEMGVFLSVDDFGTGYSSLSYLRRFPIDCLKIDQSFVRDIPGSADAAAIVSAIVAMARSLMLEIVAEGVETQEQLNYLKQLQCNRMQGFLFSRPIPAKEFEKLVKDRQEILGFH
jgi:diguanylate cyclase (GGDEF)-like protein/PAS domain S-box-containing protein